MDQSLRLSPGEFVALLNATLEYAFPRVVIEGELANFRVSKNRWVYFDIKDDEASVKFFGTVYNLPGPLEEGMLLRVTGTPRLHPLYGFSVTVQVIELSGEGTIKKAFALLQAKLEKEGLFDNSRKRLLPYPPSRIGLITSGESAAYADFVKILAERFGGIDIVLADVQVQGEAAPGQIVRALDHFNASGAPPEVLVVIRGGGSADDLQAFNTEAVTRAVAASRIPTIVAIGHEIDTSLAELAADVRASTPSNAAELLVPDKLAVLRELLSYKSEAGRLLNQILSYQHENLNSVATEARELIVRLLKWQYEWLTQTARLLEAIEPSHILSRGYAVIRSNGIILRSSKNLTPNLAIDITLADGNAQARIK